MIAGGGSEEAILNAHVTIVTNRPGAVREPFGTVGNRTGSLLRLCTACSVEVLRAMDADAR